MQQPQQMSLAYHGQPASPQRAQQHEDYLFLSEVNIWSKRWCVLADSTLQVYVDRESALYHPDRAIRSISLRPFQQLKASGDYSSHGIGQWELTLLGEAMTPLSPLAVAPRFAGLPRSTTTASLAAPLEHISPVSHLLKKSSAASLRPRQWNDSSESLAVKDKPSGGSPSTWSNKVASKSKRLYHLMSGNGSTQSLSDQLSRVRVGNDSPNEISSSPSQNYPLARGGAGGSRSEVTPSSNSISSFSLLRQQHQQSDSANGHNSIQSMLVLRAIDARSMAQWAEAISSNLFTTNRSAGSSAADNKQADLQSAYHPAHARPRRPRPITAAEDFTALYQHQAGTAHDSSMVSAAAMASRRKRLDSGGRVLEQEFEEGSGFPIISSRYPTSQTRVSRTITAADKFIKAGRRASAEVFASAMGNRRSADTESIAASRPTTSSGTSLRSSICCPGLDPSRISVDAKFGPPSGNTLSAGPTFTTSNSFAAFSSPFVSTIKRSTSRRRSGSSHSNRSSIHFLSAQGASSSLSMSTSVFDTSFSSSLLGEAASSERSSSVMSYSTSSFSPAPHTPSLYHFEGVRSAGEADKALLPKSSTTAHGLNLYQGRATAIETEEKAEDGFSTLFRPLATHAIIVESPTKEDLATLIAQQEEAPAPSKKASTSSSRFAAPSAKTKLVSSPSMPALHQSFSSFARDATDIAPSGRTGPLSKLSERRQGMLINVKRAPSPKPSTSAGGNSSARFGLQTQRPATSTGFRSGVSSSFSSASKFGNISSPILQEQDNQDFSRRRGSEGEALSAVSKTLPVVERIMPPEEMIATIDRLKKQQSASCLALSSSSSFSYSSSPSKGKMGASVAAAPPSTLQARRPLNTSTSSGTKYGSNVRPPLQTRTSSSKLREEIFFPSSTSQSLSLLSGGNVKQQQQQPQQQRLVALPKWDDLQEQVKQQQQKENAPIHQAPSLPVPPRVGNHNRKSKFNNGQISTQGQNNLEKENAVPHTRSIPAAYADGFYKVASSSSAAPKVAQSQSQSSPMKPLRTSISDNFSLTFAGRAQ